MKMIIEDKDMNEEEERGRGERGECHLKIEK